RGGKRVQVGRTEPRMATNTVANLQAAEEPLISETVIFENLSEHGARIITRRRWPAGQQVIISDALVSFRTTAEVVYCARHGSRRFAVGLKFN
ncbi:MAG: PilZ domain-containing protein, partial [Steroidobacteraceae bacterium]